MPSAETPVSRALAERLVAAHFGVCGADLTVSGYRIRDLAQQFGTPLYIYDARIMRRIFHELRSALEEFADIHFSIKANPNPEVARVFVREGAGIEIASAGEYRAARQAGAESERILFAGPGKRDKEIDFVVREGIGEIHLESMEEIRRVADAGTRLARTVPVAIRVNPVAAAQGGAMRMGGAASPFGFDEEDIDAVLARVLAEPALDLRGVHMFAGTQILDADTLLAQWWHGLDVAARIAAAIGRPLQTIELGGGLGIPYHAGDRTLDLDAVRAALPSLVARQKSEPAIRDARVIVEPGRFLCGPAGLYVVRVNTAKTSRGKRFLVTDGGMHHHLAASGNLGQVIKRDYPLVAPARMDAGTDEPCSVVGPLCTPLDTLARNAQLPPLAAGDLIAVLQSGAYGLTASPTRFLSHPLPAEILVDADAAIPLRAIAQS